MKVLFVTTLFPTEERPTRGTFVRTRVEGLRDAGVEVEVVVIQGAHQKLAYPKAALEVRRRVANGGIDVVNAVYGFAGVAARIERRVPLVVTFCGSDVLGSVDEHGRPRPLTRLETAGSRLLSRHVDEVIVPSEEMARALPRKDVHVIPHGVDLSLFSPTERGEARALLGLDPDRNYLLFAASPALPGKNYPLALAASDRLRADGVDNELLAIHRETQARLALYMSACDALIFPSRVEGSPNVVKQAMACNLPIVSTDVGDVRRLIGSLPGCYVSEPTAEAFTADLREILRQRRRTDGRSRLGHLESGAVARQVIGVYELALARRSGIRSTSTATA